MEKQRIFIQFLTITAVVSVIISKVVCDESQMMLKCKLKFTDEAEKRKVAEDCATKQKYDLKANQTIEEFKKEISLLESTDFDDRCFTKCWYEAIGALGKDGKVDLTGFETYFKTSDISPALLKELGVLFEGCLKDTEKKFKDTKDMPCKMYTMMEICFAKKILENDKSLSELCKK